MLSELVLETLYEITSSELGWLSRLNLDDEAYLVWRDEQEQKRQTQVNKFVLEETELSSVNAAINAIEKEADEWMGDNRFVFLGLSSLDQLVGLRHKLRNRLLAAEIPDRHFAITDAQIERARSVPLESLIPSLPRSRKIVCPFHQEKSPSFHVYKRGYCFGCGVSIDSIEWQMRVIGNSFVQAVKVLCELPN